MSREKNFHYQALLGIIIAGYLFSLAILGIKYFFSNSAFDLTINSNKIQLVTLVVGIIPVIGIYYRSEWGRKIILVSAMLLLVNTLKLSIFSIYGENMISKSFIHTPGQLFRLSLFIVSMLAISLSLIYFAMAYPASMPEASSTEAPLEKAR